jgi:hypothetical protein
MQQIEPSVYSSASAVGKRSFSSQDPPNERCVTEFEGRPVVLVPIEEYEMLLRAAEDAEDLKLILERIDEPNLTPEEFARWPVDDE